MVHIQHIADLDATARVKNPNRKYIFKGSVFHCYVSLPECSFRGVLPPMITRDSALRPAILVVGSYLRGQLSGVVAAADAAAWHVFGVGGFGSEVSTWRRWFGRRRSPSPMRSPGCPRWDIRSYEFNEWLLESDYIDRSPEGHSGNHKTDREGGLGSWCTDGLHE